MDRYDPEKIPPQAWVFAIATNCLRDHYKTRRQVISLDELREEHGVDPVDENAQTALRLLDERDLLRRALEALPERSREVVVLRYFADFSTRQTAEKLGITENYVQVLLSRALDRMGDFLRRESEKE